jgi:hypothetical protein
MTRPSLPCLARLGLASLALLLASSGAAMAQTPPKPAAPKPAAPAPKTPAAPPAAGTPAPAGPTYVIDGFRSAKFGMTPEEVRAAITKDFNATPAMINEVPILAQQTTALTVALDHLDPGPGAVGISYIFGATKKTLMHINVVWTTGATPADDQRRAIASSAAQLAAYFQGQTWLPKHAAGGVLGADKSVLVFLGLDAAGAAVEVNAVGVPIESKDPAAAALATPAGPAQLRLSYSADVQHPDVKTITPGAF